MTDAIYDAAMVMSLAANAALLWTLVGYSRDCERTRVEHDERLRVLEDDAGLSNWPRNSG